MLRRIHEKNVSKKFKQVRRARRPQLNPSGSRWKSLAILLEKYLQHLAVKGFSESTLRVRRVYMEMFLSWCRRNRILVLAQVTRTSLESYQRYLFQYRKKDGQPLAVASQHSRLAPLKVWFKWLT
jgi:integrase/recombinase XerD